MVDKISYNSVLPPGKGLRSPSFVSTLGLLDTYNTGVPLFVFSGTMVYHHPGTHATLPDWLNDAVANNKDVSRTIYPDLFTYYLFTYQSGQLPQWSL